LKNKLTLLLLFCFAGIFTATSQIPNYVPQNGLVGWWPFDGNFQDVSANGNNGTLSNGSNGTVVFTIDRFGMSSKAVKFASNPIWNSLGPYISIANNSSLNLNSSYTLNLWVKVASTCQTGELLNKGDDNVGFFSRIQNPLAGVAYGKAGGYINYNFPVGTTQWSMYTFTRDNVSGNGNLYINGVQVATGLISAPSSNNFDLAFGAMPNGGTNGSYYPYQGDMDDIGFWDRTLTQQEITNLYNGTTPTPCNPLSSNLLTGLVGYYPFCGNANDESGNSHNGTVSNAILSNDRFGNLNSAYYFDGSGDYIRVNHTNDLKLSGDFSISCWLSLSSLNTFNSIISKASNDQSNIAGWVWGYSNFLQPARLHFQGSPFFTGITVSSLGNNLPINTWKNVAVTYDSVSSNLKYYLDGNLTDSFNIAYDFLNSNLDIFFGNHFQNNDPSIPVPTNGDFSGSLDDICIWNRTLTQQEINQVYGQNICYQTITVTDTLLINVNLTGLNPVSYQNTIKVFPNPTNDHITIDFGTNYASLNGYSLRIDNTLGQSVFTSPVQQQSAYINLSTWTGVGVYFVYLLDNQGHVVDVRKIVLQ